MTEVTIQSKCLSENEVIPLTRTKACPSCGEPEETCVSFSTIRGWRYVECPRCALVFLNPRPTPEALAEYYNGAYTYDERLYRELVERQKAWLLGLISRFREPPGKLLEVGCSYGHFLAAARACGWQVQGIELDDRAASYAREKLLIPVRAGTPRESTEGRFTPYDVVVAWHVIEHVADTREFLLEVSGRLRDGGILALRTPNLDSAVAKLAGRRWEWLSPPDHICLFKPRALTNALVDCGFQVLLAQTARGNASNMWYEILRARAALLLVPEASEEPSLFAAPQPRRYASRPWYRAGKLAIEFGTKPVDWLISPWLARAGREAELVVIARNTASDQRQCSRANATPHQEADPC